MDKNPERATRTMLSYQHIYHAGCLPDLHKHAALAALLVLMAQKDKPITYIETHAGRGYYDLDAPEAQKTGEAAQGIRRMLKENWLPAAHPFMRVLKDTQKIKGETIYPGSAAIAKYFCRPEDKIHLMELHPGEVIHLRQQIMGKNIKIAREDGYKALLALAPPEPRRGVVFIDPSYEIKTEYADLPALVEKAMKKWPVAVLMLWYPLLPARPHEAMVKALTALGLPKSGVFEVEFGPPPESGGGWKALYGSGLFVANAPYGFEAELQAIAAALKDGSLGPLGGGGKIVEADESRETFAKALRKIITHPPRDQE